jgi:DNA-binding MarR family transcriptional regulator
MTAVSPEARYREEERLARMALERKSTRGSRLTPSQIASAKLNRKDGMTWADLGRRFGMDGQTVKRLVEAA